MTLSKFLTNTIIKGTILLLLIIILPDLMAAIDPIISNSIALGQIEHSNDTYVLMQTYQKYMSLVRFGIGTVMVCLGLSMGLDVYIFTKNKKEN